MKSPRKIFKAIRIITRKIFIHVFIHPQVASECFQSGPSFNMLANYFLNYAQLIFLDCLIGPLFALKARQAEIYKYDTALFSAKSTYKTEKGNDIWGHEVSVNLTYHTDGNQKSDPKSMPSPVTLPSHNEGINQIKEVKKTEKEDQTSMQNSKITVIREEDYDEKIIQSVANQKR